MKKVLALVLAFAMVFSTVTVAFAETEVTDEGASLVVLGMLGGDDGGYTAEYEAKSMTRLTAAAALLKLKGLYEVATEYDGVENFEDVKEYAWEAGRNLMAYLKDNPELGFGGDENGNFNPGDLMNEQSYVKVLLETLGYKQTTAEVVGDFPWEEVIEFAEGLGLVPTEADPFTIADLADLTVQTLKSETKDGEVYLDTLIAAGKIDVEDAVAAGFLDEDDVVGELVAEIEEVKAIGNTVVEIEFKEAVDAAAGEVANYAIEGLAIESAVIAGEKLVRLETEAMTGGKIYTLVVGEEKFDFAGVVKVSGGPDLEKAESEDVEEVVLTFDKKIDLESGTNTENYYIKDIEIVEASVDGEEVTLTTEGLKDKTNYTVKVTNIKSVDGAVRKSASKTFKTKVDKVAPKIDTDAAKTKAETNQRIILYFNEKVTQESAEDLDNYAIKEDKKDGEELEILSVTWDSDDKNNVEIVTEEQDSKTKYKLTVNNISDRRKVANVMSRPATWNFDGKKEDKKAPTVDAKALSYDTIRVTFKDDSRLDEDSVLDLGNYSFAKGKEDLSVLDIEKVTSETGEFVALLTVEEMETDKNHSLKVSDVVDEFGNAMKEKSITILPKGNNIASSKLGTIIVSDKKTVLLNFDKELDKDSAENIANYSVNNGIGAPTKAKYDKDDKQVKLTVNTLTNGKKYKVTVDGVTDLLGNELYFGESFYARAYDDNGVEELWDVDTPELYNAYEVNKYVVALEFNEEVAYSAGTKIKLTAEGKADIELEAKVRTDGNTVIEFSDFENKVLEKDVTYKVYGLVYGDIKDLAGNEFEMPNEEFTIKASASDVEEAELESYEQVNGKTFKLTMSKDVEIVTNPAGGVLSVDADDDNIVYLEYTTALEKDKDYDVYLVNLLRDVHGIAAKDTDEEENVKLTRLTATDTDNEKPYIVDVVVDDRVNIVVEFSEDIAAAVAGNFTIKNIDTDKTLNIKTVTVKAANEADKEKIEIELSTPLEGRYEYELKLAKDVVADYVGKTADADTWYFEGTNLAE